MRNRIRHLRRNERGMTMAFVAMGFMAFLTATTLAIDVGMFMSARSQAQTAADSGALSGAIALAFNDFDNRTHERSSGFCRDLSGAGQYDDRHLRHRCGRKT